MFSRDDIFIIIFGLGLCLTGIAALIKGQTVASPDCDPLRKYKGSSAYVLGITWLLIGIFILVAYGLNYLGYVDMSYYINHVKEVFLN